MSWLRQELATSTGGGGGYDAFFTADVPDRADLASPYERFADKVAEVWSGSSAHDRSPLSFDTLDDQSLLITVSNATAPDDRKSVNNGERREVPGRAVE